VGEQTFPKVAYGLGKYFVAWGDYRAQDEGSQVYGARVDTSGVVRDPDGIGIFTLTETYSDYPLVAFDGQNFLVAWDDYRNTTDTDVYAARVDTAGAVLDPNGFAICAKTNEQYATSVGSCGTNSLVTWSDATADDGDVFANRVRPDGTVLDGSGIPICVQPYEQGAQGTAFDGTNYFVVWYDRRNGNDTDVYGARVDTAGAVLDANGFVISGAVGDQFSPAVVFDGTTYVVVWEDARSSYEFRDIYGARVYPSGAVIDTAGFAISTANDSQECPALAHGPGRAVLIGYDSFLPLPFGSMRVMGNFWPGPTPVTFLACRAEVGGGAVTLSWQVACDVPASSFVVERSGSADGDYAALDVEVTRSNTWFSCVDSDVLPGATYWYRVSLVGVSGRETYGPVEVRVGQVPAAYVLYQSYPNPFNPTCVIRFDLPRSGNVTLRVFDAAGRVVRTVVDRWMESGTHAEVWDGKSDRAVDMPSGVYFYELTTPDFRSTRKAVMLR
jgi:hypothetical protein